MNQRNQLKIHFQVNIVNNLSQTKNVLKGTVKNYHWLEMILQHVAPQFLGCTDNNCLVMLHWLYVNSAFWSPSVFFFNIYLIGHTINIVQFVGQLLVASGHGASHFKVDGSNMVFMVIKSN